jgi:hypothetical protein
MNKNKGGKNNRIVDLNHHPKAKNKPRSILNLRVGFSEIFIIK